MALSPQHDEAKLIEAYFSGRQRRGTMIDVGAHFGSSFKPFLRQGWRVIALEPDTTKSQKLATITDPNFTLLKKAAGETPADAAQFFTSPESTGIASLLPFRESHVPAEQVAVTTLAAELAALGIRSIDYLKIDTEGYDLAVLRGHDWGIRPEVIMCEFDELKTRSLGHDYRTLGDLLLSNGYVVWMSQWDPIVRYGGTHTWRTISRYPAEIQHRDGWGNFVATLPGAPAEAMADVIRPHLVPSPGTPGEG